MSRTRAILFDVDGTLIDGHRVGRRALVRAFAEVFGLQDAVVATRADQVSFAGRTDRRIVADLAQALAIFLDGRSDALFDAYFRHLRREHAARPATALPGAAELLAALGARPDRVVGLLTGNLREGARIKLASCGLERYADLGGFGDDGIDRRDIARAAHDRVEARLGREVAPGDVVVVGDTHHDVEAARACGFVAVAVRTGFGDPQLLRASEPDLVLADLRDPAWFLADPRPADA